MTVLTKFGVNKLQVSYYAWLLEKLGYDVHKFGYLIYSIAYDETLSFYLSDNRLDFKTSIFKSKIDYMKVE